MRRIFTVLALAAMVFTACSKEENGSADGTKRIAIDPTIANPAVVPPVKSTRASDTDFEQGDAVGLTITMAGDASKFISNKKLTYDEAKKEFASETLWYEDVNMRSALYAYYPYQDGEDAPTEFSVQADQSGDGYTKSDLIVAVKADVKPSLSATAMTFKHKMTRIVIDVTNECGFDVTEISIGGAAGTGVIDVSSGAFTAKADVAASTVKAHEATKNKMYYALLVPQNGVKLMVSTTTADGKKRTYTLGTTDLKSGENRRMDLNVQPADISVKFSGPIDAWVDGDELLPDGEGSVETPTVEWGGVKYKIVTLKDGRTWMAENLRYIPAGVTVSTDPADNNAKMWAPYTSDGTTCTAVTDADEVAKLGYLYSFDLAFGAEITPENSGSFEGVRGICPEGWHIPTQAEWIGLIGKTNKNADGVDLSDLSAPYYNSAIAGGDIVKMNKDGFKFSHTGVRMRSNIAGAGSYQKNVYDGHLSMTYLLGSTLYKNIYSTTDASQLTNIQYFSPQTLFNASTPDGKLTVGYLGYKSGCAVRCIKDKE